MMSENDSVTLMFGKRALNGILMAVERYRLFKKNGGAEAPPPV
jgi:hypothetical protein